jgi:hypothetical protein
VDGHKPKHRSYRTWQLYIAILQLVASGDHSQNCSSSHQVDQGHISDQNNKIMAKRSSSSSTTTTTALSHASFNRPAVVGWIFLFIVAHFTKDVHSFATFSWNGQCTSRRRTMSGVVWFHDSLPSLFLLSNYTIFSHPFSRCPLSFSTTLSYPITQTQ